VRIGELFENGYVRSVGIARYCQHFDSVQAQIAEPYPVAAVSSSTAAVWGEPAAPDCGPPT
jgi:hypothetical protein